jgi:hypothetical protein
VISASIYTFTPNAQNNQHSIRMDEAEYTPTSSSARSANCTPAVEEAHQSSSDKITMKANKYRYSDPPHTLAPARPCEIRHEQTINKDRAD